MFGLTKKQLIIVAVLILVALKFRTQLVGMVSQVPVVGPLVA